MFGDHHNCEDGFHTAMTAKHIIGISTGDYLLDIIIFLEQISNLVTLTA